MENVINKPCLCQLEQAICCLPKPLSEQRKQIFLVERGVESPAGSGAAFSPAQYFYLPRFENAGKRNPEEGGILFHADESRMRFTCQWLSHSQKRKAAAIGQNVHACNQTLTRTRVHPALNFPCLLAEPNSMSCSGLWGNPDCELARCVIYWVASEWLSPYLHQIASPDVFFLERNPQTPASLCPDGNDSLFFREALILFFSGLFSTALW